MLWPAWLIGGIVGALTGGLGSELGAPWWLLLFAILAHSTAIAVGATVEH